MKKDIFAVDPEDAWPYADHWVKTGREQYFDASIERDNTIFAHNSNISLVAALPEHLRPECLEGEVRFVRAHGCIRPLVERIAVGDA